MSDGVNLNQKASRLDESQIEVPLNCTSVKLQRSLSWGSVIQYV